jgi:hypothetical protein
MTKILGGAILGTMMSLGMVGQSIALPTFTDLSAVADDMGVTVQVAAKRGGNVKRSSNKNVNRNTNVNRNVNRNTNVNVNRNRSVNANVNVNRSVNVVRPVRVWAPRPYYGTIVGGVALGTAVLVLAAGTAPAAPAPNMCWFWMDSSQMQGYWDYCTAPR